MLLSQLILLPVLVILGWIYVRMRPAGADGQSVIVFDAVVIILALMLSGWGLAWVANTDIGHASPIWIPILSIITTFHIFPSVLLIGWLLRRRYFR